MPSGGARDYLGSAQSDALDSMADGAPWLVSQLAEDTGRRRETVGRAVREMAARGYCVSVQKRTPGGRLANEWTITTKGAARIAAFIAAGGCPGVASCGT